MYVLGVEGLGDGNSEGRIPTQGAVPMGEFGWERARILAGRPAADRELTDLYNPLEASLYHAVSVTKVLPLLLPCKLAVIDPAMSSSFAFHLL